MRDKTEACEDELMQMMLKCPDAVQFKNFNRNVNRYVIGIKLSKRKQLCARKRVFVMIECSLCTKD